MSRSGTGFYVNSQYAYDGAGNLTQIGDVTDATYRRTLGYDAINRVTDAAGPWGCLLYTSCLSPSSTMRSTPRS